MNAEPVALTALRPPTPPAVNRLFPRCVAKQPEDR
jgi:hypothetical protein